MAGCKRNWAQSSARTTKMRAQFSAQTTQNQAQFRARMTKSLTRERQIRSQSSMRMKRGLGTILWAIDENVGTDLQAFHKRFYIGCLKTQKQQLHFVKKKYIIFLHFFLINNLGRALNNRTGCKTVWAGRSALRNMRSWNTD